MNDHIKVAQAFAEFPPEAGLDRWPWRLIENAIYEAVRYKGGFYWLLVDDSSEWSAAKFLQRMLTVGKPNKLGNKCLAASVIGNTLHVFLTLNEEEYELIDWPIFPNNLDYIKAILEIGQRAFGLGYYSDWTEEQRKPYLAAWEKGMDEKI